jgi:hypothetical protein
VTFLSALLEIAGTDVITDVIIGPYGWDDIDDVGDADWLDSGRPRIAREMLGRPLSLDIVRPLLDFEWDRGYGSPSCYALYAYSDSYIYFVSQYDGSTTLNRVPRNPIECIPHMPGG